jgi:uroporphyrinogen decarboxylase
VSVTPRERLLAVLRGQVPDCVPVCPDISNMVPARLTGKPFWEIYVHQDPPLWKAHIDAIKHFGFDGGFEVYAFGDLFGDAECTWVDRIIDRRQDGSFVTQAFCEETGEWDRYVRVHTAANPPATNVKPETIGLPPVPGTWEEITGAREWPTGIALWKLIREEMGEYGILGMPSGASTLLVRNADEVYEFYDDPRPFYERRERMLALVDERMERIAALDVRPDFLLCGSSGSLIFQSPATFRELALPVLKHVTERAHDLGIPTHVHSCGPERDLVRMAVEETMLTIIDPLETPPMGDCDLAELKQLYGDRIVLKGNLHTTRVMLHGSVDDVVTASKRAIDDAAAGGGFVLSTGDQCGRDTPDENIWAMIETARMYGRY